jgi:PAS domain S-box-containing protein
VLHLEDSTRDAEMLREQLDSGGVSADIVLVNSKECFEAALARDSFDLIITDYNLPGYDGTSAIRRAQERQPDTPVIVISGSLGEAEAVKCLHVGATDYLLKDRLDRLGPAVKRAIHEAEEHRKRKDAELAVVQRERRLSSIYETVADILFYIEVEGDGRYRFASINRTFVSTTGLAFSEIVGKRMDEVVPEPSRTLAAAKYAEAIRSKSVVRWEETSDYPNGTLTGEVTVAPVFDDEGHCTHLVGAMHDLTERKRLEAQFRQAQKMESVGQLAGGIAHDFNNLLTVINGTAELALGLVPDGTQVHQDLEDIRRAGERAAALTRQLLAFSRKQILQPQVLNLSTAVTAMESMLRRLIGENIDLVVVPVEDARSVKADPGQIEQVIANLAVNARDAMPHGGKLTIEVQNVEIDAQYGRERGVAVQPGPYVALTVSDTGVGMDEATQKRVFEPFFTTKGPEKGTGLGLSTVYGIVKQSDGFIWVYSEVGQGTTFKIFLPRVADAAGSRRAGRPTGATAHGRETILIVDDVDGLRHLAKRMLESAGYEVLTAASGEEALRAFALNERPVHLMLTDVVMPGMNGRALADQFKETRPEIKVLYTSGYTDDAIVRHGVLDPGTAFVSKPFSAAGLLRKVRQVLDSKT